MGVLWDKIGEEVVRYWPSNELFLPFWGFYVCANLGENRSRNATVRVLADGQTDWQTQTDFIICRMLYYAIAMGQIITWPSLMTPPVHRQRRCVTSCHMSMSNSRAFTLSTSRHCRRAVLAITGCIHTRLGLTSSLYLRPTCHRADLISRDTQSQCRDQWCQSLALTLSSKSLLTWLVESTSVQFTDTSQRTLFQSAILAHVLTVCSDSRHNSLTVQCMNYFMHAFIGLYVHNEQWTRLVCCNIST